MKTPFALAAPSTLAADAGRHIDACGGNAVDAAIAAALVAINTEPGVCALAGAGFVTLAGSNVPATTFDGNVTVPGQHGERAAEDGCVDSVDMAYGGGVTTLVGAGSVAVPGTLAALYAAWQRAGALPWRDVMQPAIDAARDGFPLSAACHYYLTYSGDSIFSRSPDSRAALYDGATLRPAGSTIRVPHLAESLTAIAANGPATFYRGELAARMLEHVAAGGGTLTETDLADYEAIARPALALALGDWRMATNPPPAFGGAMLAAVLTELDKRNAEDASGLVEVLEAVLAYRRRVLDKSRNLERDVRALLATAGVRAPTGSGSTIHVSAVDANGLACAVTASSGYGSGDMPAGTGLWLNNCLGEIDLNRHGLAAGEPGTRLPSNMAPTCLARGNDVIAIGSPGASRITSALTQTLRAFTHQGVDLATAIAAPRLHVEYNDGGYTLAAERGVEGLDGHDVHWYDEPSMYFGGVGAASLLDGRLAGAADPRRTGAVFVTDL